MPIKENGMIPYEKKFMLDERFEASKNYVLTYDCASCFVDHPNGTGVVSAATNANNII